MGLDNEPHFCYNLIRKREREDLKMKVLISKEAYEYPYMIIKVFSNEIRCFGVSRSAEEAWEKANKMGCVVVATENFPK